MTTTRWYKLHVLASVLFIYWTRKSTLAQVTTNFNCRSNGCCDQHEFCSFWSRTKECDSNKDWMLANCQISCNSCPVEQPSSSTCRDKHANCQFWSSINECVSNAIWMLSNCPAACNNCDKGAAVPAPAASSSSSSCKDQHRNCQFWAGLNECEKNQIWMAPNCPVSCNSCPGSQPRPAAVPAPAPAPAPASVPAPAPVPVAVPPPAQQQQNSRQTCPREDTSNHRVLSVTDIFNSNSNNLCAPQQDGVDCGRNSCFNKDYRTADGTCNNPSNPLFGANATPFIRLRSATFDDGSSAPSGSLRGGRSSPREISRFLLTSNQAINDNRFNLMLMQFGQFLVHDITKTSLLPSAKCSGCGENPGVCLPIHVETFDPRFGCQQPPCCLTASRASPVCGSNPRQLLNENTAFVDGSAIYGSSSTDMNRLRDGSSGFLRTSFFNSMVVPPFDATTCSGPASCGAGFDAGDNRVTLFVALTALSTIFLREHNRVAQQLQQQNPQWNGDRIFQVDLSTSAATVSGKAKNGMPTLKEDIKP